MAQLTHKPDSPAQEGIEVAPAGIDAPFGTGASFQLGLQAVHKAFPHHDLCTEGSRKIQGPECKSYPRSTCCLPDTQDFVSEGETFWVLIGCTAVMSRRRCMSVIEWNCCHVR